MFQQWELDPKVLFTSYDFFFLTGQYHSHLNTLFIYLPHFTSLSPRKAYSPDTIGEMKFLVRVLATKHAEAFPDYLLPPGQLYYSDYCTLVARKEDFDVRPSPPLICW